MKKYPFVIFLTLLALAGLACSLTVTVPAQPPVNPSEYMTVTFSYIPAGNGMDFTLLAQKSVANPSFSFKAGEDPTFASIQSMISEQPVAGVTITIAYGNGSSLSGTTAEDGHLNISIPATSGDASISGWFCSMVTNWQASNDGQTVKEAGGIYHCYR